MFDPVTVAAVVSAGAATAGAVESRKQSKAVRKETRRTGALAEAERLKEKRLEEQTAMRRIKRRGATRAGTQTRADVVATGGAGTGAVKTLLGQ